MLGDINRIRLIVPNDKLNRIEICSKIVRQLATVGNPHRQDYGRSLWAKREFVCKLNLASYHITAHRLLRNENDKKICLAKPLFDHFCPSLTNTDSVVPKNAVATALNCLKE